ncbi:aminotransferase class V-fold PLP-dependent enzyme [Methylobacterium sp. E-041]|uniref:cysteine desulfurase family protein n=1 Tax=Methylobacterium sp. E-041 TaxID=2836573 RepID=UPI001FB925D1|nr:aminotransferase class V-fold PLP-dependent enzyme [Methylobacterium sp. E-041]MCJ2108089.1 aminotransferase class V-fold PLP-dependent enzyme [Methylobacterium sp. E-041]
MEIYLDNLASTPVDPRVAAHQAEVAVALHGNPNSAEHASGMQSANVLTKAREDVGHFLGAEQEDTHFLPSASSALWLALEDAIARRGADMRVLASAIEHPSCLRHLETAAAAGRIRLELFPVNALGQPDLSHLEQMAQGGVDLICAMAANNEIGTIAPINEVLRLADRHGALTIVDASQAAGRFRIGQVTAAADYVVASGAKMNGPRRIGVLAGRIKGVTAGLLEPMFGTPDAAAASALALACALAATEMEQNGERIAVLRDRLEAILTERVPGLRVNGDRGARLAGALHVSSPAIPAEALVVRLWGKVALSSGAACQSGVPGPSHVLTAMGLEDWVVEGGIRMCVGKFNDAAEIERAGAIIAEAMGADLGIGRQS